MFFQNIHVLTIIISGVATMAVGGLWYSPFMFLKPFMKEMGKTMEGVAEMKKSMKSADHLKMYLPTFVLALLSAFIIAAFLNSLIITSMSGLIIFALCIWAGFSLPVAVNNTIFGEDSWKLTLINTGYQLVNVLVVTLIIGIWG